MINTKNETQGILDVENLKMTNDYIFKRVLKSKTKEGEYILKGFLEAILEYSINDLELYSTEVDAFNLFGKNIRLDILAKVNNNLIVNVEMQRSGTLESLGKRLIYYAMMLIGQQRMRGKDYSKITPIVQIAVLDERKFDDDDYLRLFQKADLEHGNILTEIWKTIIIELAKCLTNVQNYCTLKLKQQWMIFIKEYTINTTDERSLAMIENNEYLREATRVMKEIFKDPEQLLLMMAEEKAIMDELQLKNDARKEGKIEVAMNLLFNHVDIDLIAKSTGLSHQEITQLRNN